MAMLDTLLYFIVIDYSCDYLRHQPWIKDKENAVGNHIFKSLYFSKIWHLDQIGRIMSKVEWDVFNSY